MISKIQISGFPLPMGNTGISGKSLVNYRTIAPYAREAHPYPDHYMPLLTAFGAAGPNARGKVLHQSWDLGDLGMGAFEFGQRK